MRKQLKREILEYFDMPRSEQYGAIVLLFLSLVLLAAPEILKPFLIPKLELDSEFAAWAAEQKTFPDRQKKGESASAEPFRFDPNTADFEDFVALGLDDRLANQILNYREKGGHFRRPDDFSKIYNLQQADFERLRPFIFIEPIADNQPKASGDGVGHAAVAALFSFDPNRASEAEFLKLGLPKRTVRSILNYREKGGVFRKKSDFSKIYTLDPTHFARLEPFIDLPETFEKRPFVSEKPTEFSQKAKPDFVDKWPSKSLPQKIDANSATVEDWKKLPGIGDFFAQKIVRFRESLGGFSSLEQVAETRNLPDSLFQKARPFLILETPVFRKIRLNSASAEEFSQHPFLDRRAAAALVAFRENHGPFKKTTEIEAVRAVSPSVLKKLEPYLSLE